MKKLVELCVEGAKVFDLCVEGDKLLEQGTGAVYNKAVKGVKVPKGEPAQFFYSLMGVADRDRRMAHRFEPRTGGIFRLFLYSFPPA